MGLIKYILGSDSRGALKKLDKMAKKVEELEPKYQAMSDAELKGQTKIFKDRLAAGETTDDILYDAFAALREASWRVLKMKHFHVQIMGGICLHQGRIAEMKTGEGKTLVSTLPAYLNALTGKGVHIVTVNDYLAKRDAEWMGKVHKFMGLTVGVVVPGMDDADKKKAYECDIIYATNNELGFDYLRDNLKKSISSMVQRELNFCIIDEVDSILIDEARTPLIISGRGDKSSELYDRVDRFVRTLEGGFDDDKEDALKRAPARIVKQYQADERLRSAVKHLNCWDYEIDRAERKIAIFETENDGLSEMELERAADEKIGLLVGEIESWDYVFTAKGGRITITDKDTKKKDEKVREMTDEEKAATETLQNILKASRDWDYIVDRKDKSVTLTEKGSKKAERFFGINNIGDIENADLHHHIQQALKAHELFHNGEEYIISEDGEVQIVDEFTGRILHGRRYSDGLHQAIEAKEHVKVKEENKTHATVTFQNYFRLYAKLSGMTGTALTEEDEFRTIYSLDVVPIPTNRPVKRVDYADMIYSTVEGKKKAIVNEVVQRHEKGQPILIGTVTVDKSEEISRLLRRNGIKHNILNAKNHEREAEIVAQAGRLNSVTIATNMAGRGTDILLGGNPEYLAKKRMREEGFDHDMVEVAISYADREFTEEEQKARDRYAELYEMYKKETDEEKQQVIAAGGLCIIGTERHESRRIDNQLRGRSGRQGDPGDSVFFISLEDDLAIRFGGERLKKLYSVFKIDDDQCLQSKMLTHSIENAQRAIEGRNFAIRKSTLQYDEVMNEQRKTIYGERMKVLKGEDVHEQMLKYIPDYVAKIVGETVNTDDMPEKWDELALNEALRQKVYPDECTFEITREMLEKWDYERAISKISKEVEKAYEAKIENINKILTEVKENGLAASGRLPDSFAQVERDVLLSMVDNNWIDHIDAMDQLRKGIGLRGYAQQDPIIAYKAEGHEMFEEMIERVQNATISMLLKRIRLERKPAPPVRKVMVEPARPAQAAQGITPMNNGVEEHAREVAEKNAKREEGQSAPEANEGGLRNVLIGGTPEKSASNLVPNIDSKQLPKVNKAVKVGRNDPCPCGSGKKYKDCCYWKDHK